MRLLATLDGQTKAEAFVAYLLTLQISTHVESGPTSDQWEVWIRDEDRLDVARKELDSFLANSVDPKYNDAIRDAQRIVQDQKKHKLDVSRRVKTGRIVFRGGPMNGGGVPPITLTLIIIAVVVSLATNFMNPGEQNKFGRLVLEEMQFVSTEDYILSQKDTSSPKDPAASLKKGEIWRVLTPMFPHGSTMHIVFNVLALIQLGRIVERMEGELRFAILVLITGAFSSLMQGLMPAQFFGYPFFGGLSGVVFGVFGFLVAKSYLRPDLGVRLSQGSVVIMLLFLIAGFANVLGPIANMAHLGGVLAGAFLGLIDSQQAIASKKK
ncbi:MAG: rhomboid family intramembrane serine protease [Pirellulaceae bacterium]|nr:rhomboid family intramembrane serine protease [Pirellulaceae bacterium]